MNDRTDIEQALRRCVHCGFCTSACPTYVIEGNELEGPRGRITLIEAMLSDDAPPTAEAVQHIDSCLSCLSCASACPSGVDYGVLIDAARVHIEERFERPLVDRLHRRMLKAVLPDARAFGAALALGRLVRPLRDQMPARLKAMLDLLPAKSGGKRVTSGFYPAQGASRMTVGLLTGCVQDGLSPRIHHATVRVLTSIGASVVVAEEGICCGALSHHLGDEAGAERHFRATESAIAALKGAGAQMIAVTAAGCGSFLKGRAAGVSDIGEIVSALGWPVDRQMAAPMRLAYQSACALKHGQKIEDGPTLLLAQAGYTVVDLPEAHLCCGSAGTYNMLEPALSGALRARKLAAIQSVKPDAVASGNIGCIMQLAQCGKPIGHVIEWLDHALGGPAPV